MRLWPNYAFNATVMCRCDNPAPFARVNLSVRLHSFLVLCGLVVGVSGWLRISASFFVHCLVGLRRSLGSAGWCSQLGAQVRTRALARTWARELFQRVVRRSRGWLLQRRPSLPVFVARFVYSAIVLAGSVDACCNLTMRSSGPLRCGCGNMVRIAAAAA